MVHRSLLLIAAAAVVTGAASCAPVPGGGTPNKDITAANFETAISHLEEQNPQSAEALSARLEYADFLSEPAAGDCQQRLTAAQSQLDIAAGRPAINILLPLGLARTAADEYKIHLGRATCGGGHPPLKSELQQALEAAQHAVELYRNALDYQSMVIMQFNVAAAYQQLGDMNAAVPALEQAIAMDRDYGFRKDAEDNNRLLLTWKHEKATDIDVAAQMKDFPARSAEFKFNWSSTDADVDVIATDNSLIHGKIIRSTASTGLKRQIRADPKGWAVSNEAQNVTYNMGTWPIDAIKSEWSTLFFVASTLLEAPNITIDNDGGFKAVADPKAFGTILAHKVAAQISARLGIITPVSDEPPRSVGTVTSNLQLAFPPDVIQSKAAQNYGIETATWIGAKLEQGAWYQMSTPLYLPGLGLGNYLVQHNITFAFTRQVPCTAESSDCLCAEIVFHAIPDANDLSAALDEATQNLPHLRSLHFWSETDVRLVVNPDTLLPYVCDTRRAWYIALNGPNKGDPMIESVRTVSTSVYH